MWWEGWKEYKKNQIPGLQRSIMESESGRAEFAGYLNEKVVSNFE